MFSHTDRYFHELQTHEIVDILKNGAWQVSNQSITSAITNDNALVVPDETLLSQGENTAGVNAFSDIKFNRKVKRVLDVGGGQYDQNRDYMRREKAIDLLVWDPYNRSSSHNNQVQKLIVQDKADAVTSMSVLNVVSEPEARLAHLVTVKSALKMDGNAYFKIWQGEGPLKGSYLASATNSYYQANAHADKFIREIEVVFGRGNVTLDSTTANLIVARKKNADLIPTNEINHLKKLSVLDLSLLNKQKEKSMQKLYSDTPIRKIFSTNLTLFKNIENQVIEKSRHNDLQLQDEFDKKYGLVTYK